MPGHPHTPLFRPPPVEPQLHLCPSPVGGAFPCQASSVPYLPNTPKQTPSGLLLGVLMSLPLPWGPPPALLPSLLGLSQHLLPLWETRSPNQEALSPHLPHGPRRGAAKGEACRQGGGGGSPEGRWAAVLGTEPG